MIRQLSPELRLHASASAPCVGVASKFPNSNQISLFQLLRFSEIPWPDLIAPSPDALAVTLGLALGA